MRVDNIFKLIATYFVTCGRCNERFFAIMYKNRNKMYDREKRYFNYHVQKSRSQSLSEISYVKQGQTNALQLRTNHRATNERYLSISF